MFYTVKEMRSETTAQIARDLNRDSEAVLDFAHEFQETSGKIGEFELSEVCETDEVYVTAGEKGREDSNKGRGDFEGDKPPVLTLVRRSDARVRFLVRENLADGDEEIVEYGDENDPAILCTDQYTISDGIDESDEIDVHLVINHDEHYVVSDAHTNSCENRHSFLRNWLGRFRDVSKHHLQGI